MRHKLVHVGDEAADTRRVAPLALAPAVSALIPGKIAKTLIRQAVRHVRHPARVLVSAVKYRYGFGVWRGFKFEILLGVFARRLAQI